MNDLIERIKAHLQAPIDATQEAAENRLIKGGQFLVEALSALQAEQWISVENRLPEETGQYLCKLVDYRDEVDSDWFEVTQFSASKAFDSAFITANFDLVTHWKPITGPTP